MADLTNPKLMYLKAWLFLFGGVLAAGLILFETRDLKLALLLAIAIWCFARFYYFTFYVIQHYIDPTYRFAGLYDFLRYILKRK